ncbi:single-stranded DNA-binding protein [Oligella sp. HMSC05A10]|uniref:single-stranded DNA-binding protein n=1 Tax=Oligella TaxID=90243 RepID=UPI0003617A84|nr:MULTISPECIES: single-stranded DNA-binding protein [Oligella]OFS84226.1 single-stranded DNA-binding protein [Oligella sp. HMSC05A10]SUA63140.1 Helix-destabilizing protein [Oligella urethralis]
MSVNKVILVGRLGADPEARATPTGLQVCNLSIATNHVSYDRDGNKNESTEWHRVVFFGRQAEVCEQYLRKGSQIYVEGRLQTRKYTDRDGIERYATDVVGERMQMLGDVGRGPGSTSVDGGWKSKSDTGGDDVFGDNGGFGNNTRSLPPGRGGQNPPSVKQPPAQPSRKPDSFDELEDDLPF